MIDWLFRNRQTGQLTVAQVPNAPLIVFLVVAGIRWVLHPSGAIGAVLSIVATAALVVWAGDELVRGVNPWRRALGAVVLAFIVVGLLVR